ncbi:CPBP family intramembrane glutamic endopeptidase [Poritiphilus flavus]|uniref:CPBP family intramembrane metalloprotease n=1 Tax=Poritiphilus flavus TaxID=2697053 RepID=A0A6L9E7U2_9FLAO|nr:CPBP family intramembrane glutamic endopeptidase [Poritiphilus flavus]NAS10770.1 CPBP family intramembrane metalloprotease [Poritiphilus flavus]
MEKIHHQRRDNRVEQWFKKNPMSSLIELLMVFGSVILIIELFKPSTHQHPLRAQAVVWGANVLMIAMVCLGQWLRGEPLKDLGFAVKTNTFKKILQALMWSVPVFVTALAAFILASALAPLLFDLPAHTDTSGYNYFKDRPGLLLLSLLGVYLVSSFGEELVYRAFLMDRLGRLFKNFRLQKLLMVVFSAIIFGLAHYTWGLVGVFQTTFMGIALAVFYLALGRRLIILIMAHVYMDTLLFLSIYFGGA